MFVMKKSKPNKQIASVNQCLVFHEDSIIVPDELQEKHCLYLPRTQMEYARFVIQLKEENKKNNRKLKYTLTDGALSW